MDKVDFVCGYCENTHLIEVNANCDVVREVTGITDTLSYGEVDISYGDIWQYECSYCGAVLHNEDGTTVESVAELKKALKLLKVGGEKGE